MSPLKGSKDPEHRPIDTRQTFQGAMRSLKPKNSAGDNARLGACLRHETPKLSNSNGIHPAELGEGGFQINGGFASKRCNLITWFLAAIVWRATLHLLATDEQRGNL